MYIYSDPKRETDPHALPDVEVFWLEEGQMDNGESICFPQGWYWQSCFPGCLPDGEVVGPFETEREAIADVRSLTSSVSPPPDVEVVWLPASADGEYPQGWFWWSCFPDGLPDSDPVGPFKTELEAIEDAQSYAS